MFKELEKNILKYPERDIIYYLGRKIKNRELHSLIEGFAGRLSGLGVKCGDVVTIALPNIPEAIIAFYAVNKIGGICNMVHPKSPAKKTLAIMEKTNSHVAVLVDSFYLEDKAEYDNVGHTYIFADISTFLPKVKRTFYRLQKKLNKSLLKGETFFGGEAESVETHKFPKNAPAVYLHSSGTLGKPKTVVLSCESMNFVAVHGIELLPCEDTSNKGMLVVLPMFHGFGLCTAVHTPLIHNMQVVLIPRFSGDAVVSAMKGTHVSVMCGVPKMFEKLLMCEGFVSKDILQRLEVAFCGGEAVSSELYDKFNTIMRIAGSKCVLLEGYGLTETVTVCAVNTVKDNKKGSCGKPIAGVRIKILDENGKEVSRGELGEIAITAPSVMLGYLQGGDVAIGGYLMSGDIGYIDDDGFLFFKQREKHVIKVSGFNVYPAEIVDVAKNHLAVENCVVLKGENLHGEFARLIVQVKVGTDTFGLEREIGDYISEYLESWCVPKEIILFDGEMPLNMVGKVDLIKLQKILNDKNLC